MIFRRPGLAFALLLLLPMTAMAQTPAKPDHEKPRVIAAPHTPARHAPSRERTRKAAHPAAPAAAKPEHVAKHETPAAKHETAAKPAKPPPPPENPNKGTVTGLALPRFAALRADDVNMRAGPGDRYPIEWLYKRRGLPVEIDREFEVWRLVTAPDGTKGWVHEATLVGWRDFIVTGTERTLRAGPAETARAVAILKPGVVGRIRACAAKSEWCQVRVGDYRGWLQRDTFWGALPDEVIAPG